jgi:hypothetical protein
MRLTVRKDIARLRAAGIARVNAAAGRVRARSVTVIPAQDMVYLEKAFEARRFLAAHPTPEDAPELIDTDPVLGFPWIAAEIGITAPSAFEIAQVYVQGAALFRAAGAAIDGVRLAAVRAIELAESPAEIAAAEAACAQARKPRSGLT